MNVSFNGSVFEIEHDGKKFGTIEVIKTKEEFILVVKAKPDSNLKLTGHAFSKKEAKFFFQTKQ